MGFDDSVEKLSTVVVESFMAGHKENSGRDAKELSTIAVDKVVDKCAEVGTR